MNPIREIMQSHTEACLYYLADWSFHQEKYQCASVLSRYWNSQENSRCSISVSKLQDKDKKERKKNKKPTEKITTVFLIANC